MLFTFIYWFSNVLSLQFPDECITCIMANFAKMCKTTPGVLRPKTLVKHLDIHTQFKHPQQHCAAEFLQEFLCKNGHNASMLQHNGLLDRDCSLDFLQSHHFEQTTQTWCRDCEGITSTTAMESILHLHVSKVNATHYNKLYQFPLCIQSSSKAGC